MKLVRELRKKLVSAGRAFMQATHKNNNSPPFVPSAYYITLDRKICSMTPYIGWKKARRAAKRFNHRASIMRGETLNNIVKDYNWKLYDNAWQSFQPKEVL